MFRFWMKSNVQFVGLIGLLCGAIGFAVRFPVPTQAQDQLPAPEIEDSAESIPLSAILDGDAPENLSHGYIETILAEELFEGDVITLGYEASSLLSELYEDLPDAQQTSEIIANLTAKRDALATAQSSASDADHGARLGELVGRLDTQLELFSAIGDLVSRRDLSDPTLGLAVKKAQSAFAALKRDLSRVTTGDQWSAYFRLDKLAPVVDGGLIDDAAISTSKMVHSRLSDGSALSDEQKEFIARDSVVALATALNELDAAIESTGDRDVPASLAEELKGIVAAFNSYQRSGLIEDAATLRQAIDTLPGYGGGSNRLVALLNEQFMGNNFRIDISEELARRILDGSQFQQGVVNECVFGTRVVGQQCTTTDLSVDVKPSMTKARFDLVATGTVRTNTRGLDPRATVYTRGNHFFTARKVATFDGYDFVATNTAVGVNVNSNTYAARAKTNFPIVKGIVQNIALQRAAEMKPKTNALQRSKVTRRVRTQFDDRFDESMGKAEDRINNELYVRLREAGLFPERQNLSSTETNINLQSRMFSEGELAGRQPRQIGIASSGLMAHVHESYLNNALSRMNLAGRTMTSDEVKAEMERFGEIVAGRDLTLGERSELTEEEEVDEEIASAKFLFDESDPIRVRIDAGQLNLIITAGLETSKETIAKQVIEIPINFEIEGDEIVVTRGRIEVTPVERPRSRARQIAAAKVIASKIRASLPERRAEGTINIEMDSKTVPLVAQSISAYGGWMSLSFR